MEVLIHILFTLIKLAILGSIYTTIVLLFFKLIEFFQPKSCTNRIFKKKLRFWFSSGAIISTGIFLFATTHWGNHGLGDSARIPLHYRKTVNQMNGTQAYIEGLKYQYGALWVDNFAITSDYLVGKTKSSPVDNPKDYFVWNLKTNKINYFDTENEYEEFAENQNLPLEKDFKPFWNHYSDFWDGWRFWTLL